MDVIPSAFLAAVMDSTYTGAMKINLFTAPPTLDPTNVLTDFQVPTASWYSPATSAWNPTYENSDGSLTKTAHDAQFNYSGSDAPTTILGWFTTDISVTTLYSSGFLPTPVVMGQTYDSCTAKPSINFTVPDGD